MLFRSDEIAFNLCVDGNAQIRTWWDENDTELELIAPEDSRKCPGCGAVFASPNVPRAFATLGIPSEGGPVPMAHSETLRDTPPPEGGEASALHPKGIPQVTMSLCPFCDEARELHRYPVNEREALGKDAFGRDMGVMVPRGNALLDVVTQIGRAHV